MRALADVQAFLRECGAESIEHPGGTLYGHLVRVHDRLGGLGLAEPVRLAGLTHAVYGTDGFDVTLVDRDDRAAVRALVGDQAELIVYRYGGCDRARTWASLAGAAEVWSRFEDRGERLGPDELRSFVDLSIVNELDVVEQSAAIAGQYGDLFRARFTEWVPLASPQVIVDARHVLGF